MKLFATKSAYFLWLFLASTILPRGVASAQAPAPAPAPAETTQAVLPNERLSDWLLRRPLPADAYPMGLRWLVPEERDAQAELKAQLLQALRLLNHDGSTSDLIELINALPITGRVPLATADARWLQANSAFDPVFTPGHSISTQSRSSRVALLMRNGSVCTMNPRDGAVVQDYLAVCDYPSLETIDEAWVIQSDGNYMLQRIANWNAAPLTELSPGSIIWAPPRDSRLGPSLSRRLAAFLATQTVDSLVSHSNAQRLPQSSLRPSFKAQQDLPLTSNDWGLIGVMQTPSARMASEGEFRFNYSLVGPYRRYNVFVQPFNALSVGFRYSDITNQLYGSADKTGTRTLTDKSIDFKLRLLEEDHRLPQLAVGITDVGGTGIFSSEYVVASKRTGNFDWSLGLGWGNIGASNNLGNPLAKLDSSFNSRSGVGGSYGGQFRFDSFFRGSTALFGGVQYHLPSEKWVLKAEYDGNDYQSELTPLRHSSAINLGVVYRQSPSIDWSVGLERGRAMMLGVTIHAPMAQVDTPKSSDMTRPPVVYTRASTTRPLLATAVDISALSGWGARRIAERGDTLKVEIDALSGAHWDDRIDRIVAALHRDAPSSINRFDLVLMSQGVALSRRVVDRDQWALANTQLLPPSRRAAPIMPLPPERIAQKDATIWEREPRSFSYGLTPSWQQSIGGPDAFVLFSAGLAVPLQWSLAEDWNVSGALKLNLIDNYENFTYTAPSNLPRVRTYMREYMTESRINLPNLQLTHFGQASANNFYSLYGGYLESSFAGVGAEWLYRPWHSPVAFGVDVNHVKQRSFNQFFGFGSAGTQTGYKVSTGHATVYWDTGWKDVQAKIAAGQYLARDRGVTLDLSRTFNNGVSVGAWATKTNISSAQFGEGSFDKGMYLKIPFDVLMTSRTGDWANLVYQPLTRDGGARLNRSFQLYGATTARGKRDTSYRPYNR